MDIDRYQQMVTTTLSKLQLRLRGTIGMMSFHLVVMYSDIGTTAKAYMSTPKRPAASLPSLRLECHVRTCIYLGVPLLCMA